jgi:hypothetical protein
MYTISFYNNENSTGSTTIINRSEAENYFMARVERYCTKKFYIDVDFKIHGFAVCCLEPLPINIRITGQICKDLNDSLTTKCNNMIKNNLNSE